MKMLKSMFSGAAQLLWVGAVQANVLVVNEDNDRYLLNAKERDLTVDKTEWGQTTFACEIR